jgi:hypothetical protein
MPELAPVTSAMRAVTVFYRPARSRKGESADESSTNRRLLMVFLIRLRRARL